MNQNQNKKFVNGRITCHIQFIEKQNLMNNNLEFYKLTVYLIALRVSDGSAHLIPELAPMMLFAFFVVVFKQLTRLGKVVSTVRKAISN